MKIKHRLGLMTVLPLVFLLGFAANTTIYLNGNRSSAMETVKNAEAAIVISDLVHALQVERGSSAGFISSGGQILAIACHA